MTPNLPAVIPQPEPEPEPRDRFGRPTKFRPEYVEEARILCEDGATDKELADHFDVGKATITRWRLAHPEFANVLKIGKAVADDRVERTLYERAVGYSLTVTETFKLKAADGSEQIIEREVEKFIPPDPECARWWLKNRRPDQWRDKVETETLHVVVQLTPQQAREKLQAKIDAIRQASLGDEQQAG